MTTNAGVGMSRHHNSNVALFGSRSCRAVRHHSA
jgi:hypothetical protein